MKPLQLIFLTVFFLAGGLLAQNTQVAPAVRQDSSAATAKNIMSQIKNTDEDLILDDNNKSILPAENKKASAPVPAPAAKVTADNGTKSPAAAETAGAGQPSKPQSPSRVKDTAKKVTDEELILEGGEEDLLSKEKTVKTKATAPAAKAVTTVPDSANAAPGRQRELSVSPASAGSADTTAQRQQSSEPGAPAAATAVPPAPVVIENVRSINFARNLKEYRNPKIAMLMSLVVPGSGQVYAKSNVWAAAFGVIEVALISTGFLLSSKAKNLKNQAHTYADQHYNPASFQQYTNDLKQYLNSNPSKFGQNPDSVYKEIFFIGADSLFLEDARRKNDSYYDEIAKEELPFVRGWNDMRPVFSGNDAFESSITPTDPKFENIPQEGFSYRFRLKSDTTVQRYGVSDLRSHYIGMLTDSRQWSSYSRTTFQSLLINHLISSIMAGIAAKRHNDELLGKESFWQHINIEQRYVFTGSETAPGYALQVRF